jgi:5-methylcytosine-specific restriction protein A
MSIKRTPLSQRQKEKLWEKQGGLCAIEGCREPLKHGRFEDDHILALVDNGTNDLSNRRLICIECHKLKSIGEHKQNSKVKRLKYGRTKSGRPMPGTKASGIRKRMNGTIEPWEN